MIAAHGSFVYIETYFMQTKRNKGKQKEEISIIRRSGKKTIYFDVSIIIILDKIVFSFFRIFKISSFVWCLVANSEIATEFFHLLPTNGIIGSNTRKNYMYIPFKVI